MVPSSLRGKFRNQIFIVSFCFGVFSRGRGTHWNHVINMQSCAFLCVLLLQEFFHYTVGAILVFIASIVAATKSKDVSALVTASVCEAVYNTFALHKLTSQTGTPWCQLWFPVLCCRYSASLLHFWWWLAYGPPTVWPAALLMQV